MLSNRMNIAVIGGSVCSRASAALAHEAGSLIARQGWVLVCGGGKGVMEAACAGACQAGGLTIGILPGSQAAAANRYVRVAIPTGLGLARNILVVRAADAVIAIDGKHGTLSEIAFALNENKDVYGINTWRIKGVKQMTTLRACIRSIKRRQR